MGWDEPEDSSETITATDETGCVQVTLDPSSGRLIDVRLSALWREKVGVAGFTSALVEAVTQARLRYLEALTNKPQQRDRLTVPALPPDAWRRLSLEDQLKALSRIADLLNAVRTEASEVLRRRQTTTADYTGSDTRHTVRVTLNTAGALAGLTIDDDWLAAASTARVVSAVKEAFDAAYACLQSARDSTPLTPTPATDRALALTSNPHAFLRWLRQEDS
jgi:nicotinamidase-related amidase